MQYLLLYKGPATPSDASHEGWREWFMTVGDALVDKGSALAHGNSHKNDGSQSPTELPLNGYTIVEAEDNQKLQTLVKTHPYSKLGPDYTIEVFELPGK